MKKTVSNLSFTDVSVEESETVRGGDAATDLIQEQLAYVERLRSSAAASTATAQTTVTDAKSSTTSTTSTTSTASTAKPATPLFPIMPTGILAQNITV